MMKKYRINKNSANILYVTYIYTHQGVNYKNIKSKILYIRFDICMVPQFYSKNNILHLRSSMHVTNILKIVINKTRSRQNCAIK